MTNIAAMSICGINFFSETNRPRTLKLSVQHWGLEPFKDNWAATWQNQQNGCASSKDSHQPGHPPSLIRVFVVRMKKAWVLSYPLSTQRRLWSDWVDAQADLSLCWAHSHFVGFVMRRLIYEHQRPKSLRFILRSPAQKLLGTEPFLIFMILRLSVQHQCMCLNVEPGMSFDFFYRKVKLAPLCIYYVKSFGSRIAQA